MQPSPVKRRPLSMTSLIDVIFLLLLFFMLTSTFSKFADVELAAAAGQGGGAPSTTPPLFLTLAEEDLALNGQASAVARLADDIATLRTADGPQTLLVSLRADVTAQRLTDVLVAVRQSPELKIAILGGS